MQKWNKIKNVSSAIVFQISKSFGVSFAAVVFKNYSIL